MEASKFWALLEKRDDGCWIWPRSIVTGGYGAISIGGKTERAHRYAYMLVSGVIPKGYFVCHTCDIRRCCNPAHLWLGTVADNNADAKAKGRSVICGPYRGEAHPRSKLTNSQREQIVELKNSGLSFKKIAPLFGIADRTASAVYNSGKPGASRATPKT